MLWASDYMKRAGLAALDWKRGVVPGVAEGLS